MKHVCVFCGASAGNRPSYKQAAEKMGQLLAAQNRTLVYGGGHVGLMGVVADAVLAAGGTVIGVIPKFLADKEIAHPNLTELILVSSMHERKAKMAELADGFVAMPGGYGTLEEFTEILTWAQLGLHQKPFGLLNIEGFYDPLLGWFDLALQEGFLADRQRKLVLEATDPDSLLTLMTAWKSDGYDRWAPSPGKSLEDNALENM